MGSYEIEIRSVSQNKLSFVKVVLFFCSVSVCMSQTERAATILQCMLDNGKFLPDLDVADSWHLFRAIAKRHHGVIDSRERMLIDVELGAVLVDFLGSPPLHRFPPAGALQASRMTEVEYGILMLSWVCEPGDYSRWSVIDFLFGVLAEKWCHEWFVQFVAKAQLLSIHHQAGILFTFMIERGLYDEGRNLGKPFLLHQVGNSLACERLLLENFPLDRTNDSGRTPLVAACSACEKFFWPDCGRIRGAKGVLRTLIHASSNIDELSGAALSVDALEVLLEVCPTFRNQVKPLALLKSGFQPFLSPMTHLQATCRLLSLFRQNNMGIENLELWAEELAQDESSWMILCSLFMFGYIEELPGSVVERALPDKRPRKQNVSFFLWRPELHFFHPLERRQRIVSFLLSLNRVCPQARDVRFKIIDMMVCFEMFGDEDAEPVFASKLDQFLRPNLRLL
jgi:hypothetical protein